MGNITNKRQTFVVQILDTQNLTWQGTVTWLDSKNKESFRSLLELVRLIDSAISPEQQFGLGDAQS